MKTIFATIACALIALAAGLSSANYTLERGFGFQKKTSGAWSGWIRATAPNADPYTKAHFGRNGVLPPPPLESLLFTARQDDAGRPLSAECVYRVNGPFPPARNWTLAAYGEDGGLFENPAGRYGFSNDNILYSADGSAAIAIASTPLPGNWLPIGNDGAFELALAVYDTPLATEAFLANTVLPRVKRQGCAS